MTVLTEVRAEKWPEEGDVFFLQTADGNFYLGQVLLGKKHVGPFKNALIIGVFSAAYDRTPDNPHVGGMRLLAPPMITNNSCWENGIFHTTSKDEVDKSWLNKLLFVNPLNNKAYGVDDGLYAGNREGMIIGERSLFFCNEVIRKIEESLS